MIAKERVAVITGATGGLGSVVARRLGEEGLRLALFSTNEERLGALAGELGLPDEQLLIGAFDFTQPEAAKEAAEKVVAKFGRVDMLLHVVGGWMGGKLVV